MEAVKSLDARPRRTPRRKRTRNVRKVAAGTGEALPGPAARETRRRKRRARLTGFTPGSGRGAGRASEAAVVPLEPDGQRRPPAKGKDRRFIAAPFSAGKGWRAPSWLVPPNKTRSKPRNRRSTGRPRPTPNNGSTRTGGEGRMPAVNDVGEPCAGEPHARFDAAGAGNGASATYGDGLSPRRETAGHMAAGPSG